MDFQRMIEDITNRESIVSDKIIHYEMDHLSGMAWNAQDEYDKDTRELEKELDSIKIEW